MKVGSRLAIGFSLVILCIWAIILLARGTYSKIHQEVELLKVDIVPGTIVMTEMHRTAFEIAHQVMDYIVHSEEGTKGQLQSKIEYIKKLGLEHLQHERHLGQKHLKAFEKVIILTNGMTSQVEEIIRLKDHGMSVDELLKREVEAVHKAVAVLSESMGKHTGEHREELDKTVEAVHEAHTSGLRFLVLLAAVVTLLAVAVSLFITRSIVKPLHALEKGTELIGQGNLDYRVGTHVRDEIGELSRAFDQMTRDLQRSTVSIESLEKEITDRKRAEEELEQEKQEKEMILDSLVEHVVYQNLENKVLWANRAACESVQKTREAVVGQHCYEIWAGRQSTCEECPVIKALSTGDPQAIEKTTPDGRSWYIQGYPVRGINRDIVGVVELTLDITGRKRAEEERRKLQAQLQHAQKLESIGTLTSGVAHNFRNLLTPILLHSQFIQIKYKDDPQLQEMAEKTMQSVIRGAQLVDGLMQFSRKHTEELETINLAEVLQETYELITKSFDKKIDIRMDIADSLPIRGDRSELSQVFMNLCTNARDAMPDGGELSIEASVEGDDALITISDAGLGMDEQTREQCFDPFFTTKEVDKGTGLGLSTAYGIVKDHGGEIHVFSELNKGTTFKLYFPLALSDEHRKQAGVNEVVQGSGEKVLIVDDEADILEILVKLTEQLGYCTVSADSGKAGIDKYKSWQPDVVLLDRNMPEMDGLTCARSILEYDPEARIVLISGYDAGGASGVDDKTKALIKGYLTKPINMEQVSQTIQKVLDKD